MNQQDIDTFLAQLSPPQETVVHLREAVGVLKGIKAILLELVERGDAGTGGTGVVGPPLADLVQHIPFEKAQTYKQRKPK
ncbi:hypothetical protein HU230_0012525 [Bradyrhizobium quebecense]|uniref:Uncharacterized protein n=1 Tax=Bradyrhizobium quebecense TaxID=2748629 RepID=A0A974AEN9_9BRAD|nr:hypothetical protein [Bradyrhizobium quebecense]UGA46814.1 hypothetical protein HU230_0012525 [Bradyrhizobium quebecense]